MRSVNKNGNFFQIDEKGHFVNRANYNLIDEKWLSAINDFKQRLIDNFRTKIITIYLRGSVAESRQIDYVSDVDILIISSFKFNVLETKELSFIGVELGLKYNFVSKFDIDIISYRQLFNDLQPKNHYQFIIKTQAILLYGKICEKKISDFGLDNFIYSQLPFIQKKIDQAINLISNPATIEHERVGLLCSWIFKAIIRAAFERTFAYKKQYTRDLYLSYKTIIKYYPRNRRKLMAALQYSINPISDKEIILKNLFFFKKWFLEIVIQ